MAQYIDKAAVVAEIERLDDFYHSNSASRQVFIECLLDFLDTIELKEASIEEIAKKEYLKLRRYGGRDNMLVVLNELQFNDIAKYFFELGLKARI